MIKLELPLHFSNLTSGYISRKGKNSNSKRYVHLNVLHRSAINNSQDMEAAKTWKQPPSASEQLFHCVHTPLLLYMVCVHNGILLSHKKNEIPFATMKIDLEIIILSQTKTNIT